MLTFYDNVLFTQQQISTILTEISDLSLLWKLRKTLFPVLCIVSTELTGVPMLRSNYSIKPATTLSPFQCKLNEAFSVNVEIWKVCGMNAIPQPYMNFLHRSNISLSRKRFGNHLHRCFLWNINNKFTIHFD